MNRRGQLSSGQLSSSASWRRDVVGKATPSRRGFGWAAMENEKDTTLTAITSGSKYFSYVRSPAPSQTQTLSNPFQNLTNKEVKYFMKEIFLHLSACVVITVSLSSCDCLFIVSLWCCRWLYNSKSKFCNILVMSRCFCQGCEGDKSKRTMKCRAHILFKCLEHSLGTYNFRPTWPDMIIEVLATDVKFLEPFGYCNVINCTFIFLTTNLFGIMAKFEFKKYFLHLRTLYIYLCTFKSHMREAIHNTTWYCQL